MKTIRRFLDLFRRKPATLKAKLIGVHCLNCSARSALS
jgi:hypothetical protein